MRGRAERAQCQSMVLRGGNPKQSILDDGVCGMGAKETGMISVGLDTWAAAGGSQQRPLPKQEEAKG